MLVYKLCVLVTLKATVIRYIILMEGVKAYKKSSLYKQKQEDWWMESLVCKKCNPLALCQLLSGQSTVSRPNRRASNAICDQQSV